MTRLALALIAVVMAIVYFTSHWANPAPNRPESQQVASSALSVDRGDFSRADMYLRIRPAVPTPSPTAVVIPVFVSHYSCSEQEGTADCITFDGSQAGPGTIASNDWPIGTGMIIESKHYTVTDRGGGLARGQIDMWVPDRETAFKLGVKHTTATIKETK